MSYKPMKFPEIVTERYSDGKPELPTYRAKVKGKDVWPDLTAYGDTERMAIERLVSKFIDRYEEEKLASQLPKYFIHDNIGEVSFFKVFESKRVLQIIKVFDPDTFTKQEEWRFVVSDSGVSFSDSGRDDREKEAWHRELRAAKTFLNLFDSEEGKPTGDITDYSEEEDKGWITVAEHKKMMASIPGDSANAPGITDHSVRKEDEKRFPDTGQRML